MNSSTKEKHGPMTKSITRSASVTPEKEAYVLVVGLGRSGEAMARFLKARGMQVRAVDRDTARHQVAATLSNLGINCDLGPHAVETFENASRIYLSPGVPLDLIPLERARAKGVPISGECDLITRYLEEPIVAITGTNGKTTVTTLISEMLKESGLGVFTGGNIGTPVVEYLDGDSRADVVVAELSSFQLDTAERFAPDVAVLLNITEDHLDRYMDFYAYARSKWSIFSHQNQAGRAIVNASIPDLDENLGRIRSRVFLYGTRSDKAVQKTPGFSGAVIDPPLIRIVNAAGLNPGLDGKDLCLDLTRTGLIGAHNHENIAAAALASLAAGGTMEGIQRALDLFKGLSHRIEYAGTKDGVAFYDDSKGTNPDAVVRALEAFDSPVVLILGGRSKQTDFSCLTTPVRQRVKQIVALGESREFIARIFAGICPVVLAGSMAHAVTGAFGAAVPGDVVLLSPACASFDMYENYAQRGRDFVNQVTMLQSKKS
ncbi:MAG: UDP-N-acetylmuramoyl-L-alanine--D-glutamate ligase [Pseudomonadota bacterium]